MSQNLSSAAVVIGTLRVNYWLIFVLFRALQFPPEAWLRISLNHASLTWIHIRPDGRVGIRSMGEAGHMPANKISVL